MSRESVTTDKLKILIATGIFPPQEGGPATYSALLLSKLPELGFEPQIVNFGDVLRYPKIVRHFVYTALLIRAGWSSDIVYAQDPVSVGLPAVIASTLLRKKLVVKIVGDYAWEQGTQRFGVTDLLDEFSVNYKKYSLLTKLLKSVELFVANHAVRIIVPSNYLKTIVSNWGVNPLNITVIYNAFDTPEISESKAELRVGYGYRTPTIISAGRLVPWKGFRTLIGIMPEIIAEVPDAKLLITGSGPDEHVLRADIEALSLQNSVSLLGKIPHKDLLSMMKASDLFALNTSYEGFSHLILEALAVEVPIVTTRVGGNGEIIEDKKNGRLVPFDDKKELTLAIVQLLKQKGDAFAYSKEGARTVSTFTTTRMLAELSETFTKLL